MRSRRRPVWLGVFFCLFAGLATVLAQPGMLKSKVQLIEVRLVLVGPEGIPTPPGSAVVNISRLALGTAGVACANTSASQQPPPNTIVADSNGGCTFRYQANTVLHIWAPVDSTTVTPAAKNKVLPRFTVNTAFTSFQGCAPLPGFPNSPSQPETPGEVSGPGVVSVPEALRHCTLTVPPKGQAQVKALFSR